MYGAVALSLGSNLCTFESGSIAPCSLAAMKGVLPAIRFGKGISDVGKLTDAVLRDFAEGGPLAELVQLLEKAEQIAESHQFTDVQKSIELAVHLIKIKLNKS